MRNAATCVPMCQPSARRAMEWNRQPARISTVIMTAVSAITRRVFRSAVPRSGAKSWIWQLPGRSLLGSGDIKYVHHIADKLLVCQPFSELLGDPCDRVEVSRQLGKELHPCAALHLIAARQRLPRDTGDLRRHGLAKPGDNGELPTE